MTIKELKSYFFEELDAVYPQQEISSFYFLLLENRLKLSKTEVIMRQNTIIQENDLNHFKQAVQLLNQEKPIQYIIGETEFCGFTFKVNKEVLIPRPETEELVYWAIEDSKSTETLTTSILDIGTGSGCIAIALAKLYKNAQVSAIDISKTALAIAKKNARANAVQINFMVQDILDSILALNTHKYDVIVSNPPYVRESEKQEIKNNVLQNEPHLALFVDDNKPLKYYDKIADFAKVNLSENGKLFFEINQYLAIDTVTLLKQKGFKSIELREDLFGNKRMLKATLK